MTVASPRARAESLSRRPKWKPRTPKRMSPKIFKDAHVHKRKTIKVASALNGDCKVSLPPRKRRAVGETTKDAQRVEPETSGNEAYWSSSHVRCAGFDAEVSLGEEGPRSECKNFGGPRNGL